jgi:hypothetical protein
VCLLIQAAFVLFPPVRSSSFVRCRLETRDALPAHKEIHICTYTQTIIYNHNQSYTIIINHT